jgi:hypothetical protein
VPKEAKQTEQTMSDLAASLTQPLEQVVTAAHELRNRIAPDVIASGSSTYRLGEVRRELELASGHVSNAVIAFKRVAELTKGL